MLSGLPSQRLKGKSQSVVPAPQDGTHLHKTAGCPATGGSSFWSWWPKVVSTFEGNNLMLLMTRRHIREAEEDITTPATTSTSEKEEMTENDENNEVDTGAKDDKHAGHLDLEHCNKCLKAAYKYKKEFFCDRCLKQGMVKPGMEKKVNCKKCTKPKYRGRNVDFCEAECPDTEVKVTTEETTTTTTAKPQLGVLGNVFKYLINVNTWGLQNLGKQTVE